MKIIYYTKNVYGVAKKYVLDDAQSEIVSMLTCQSTLSDRHIKALQLLGHEVKGTTVKGLNVTHPASNISVA